MSGLKTLLTAMILASSTLWHSAAQARDDNIQLRTFATCAGQLSALMEHQWMFDGPGSEQTEVARNTVIEFIEAIMPPDQGRTVLAWRIEAKVAHAGLLTRAAFSQDEAERTWALRTATARINLCRQFLLG